MPTDDTPRGPPAGLTVLDLTRILAGPYATMLLADLSARVIKVELPGQGDDTGEVGPFIEHETGGRTSAYFASVNRSKESIALDLKAPADRASSRAAADWVHWLTEADIACGPVNDVAALRDDPQVRARHMLVDLPLPGGGTLAVAGCPLKFDGDAAPRFRAAPQLDQHRKGLLAELGLATA